MMEIGFADGIYWDNTAGLSGTHSLRRRAMRFDIIGRRHHFAGT